MEISNVVFRRDQRVIYDGLTASVPRGKITAIVGPSGTGKTTLLRLISGQLNPDAGDISVDGLSVRLLKRKALFDLRRRMGMLFQSGALFTELSVFENVAFPLRVHTDLDDELIRLVVSMKLEAVGSTRRFRPNPFRTLWWYAASRRTSTSYRLGSRNDHV